MTGDISRFLHEPNRHYSAARLQQGRILLDSDLNEGAMLLEADHRLLTLDVVGPKGTPDDGFSIGRPFSSPQALLAGFQTPPLRRDDPLLVEQVDLRGVATDVLPVTVRSGAFYVGGTRLHLEKAEHIAFQRDYLQLSGADLPEVNAGDPFRQLYFAHNWEQCVTALEDDEISEPMLRAPHSSVRVRTMRRVEVFAEGLTADDTATDAFDTLVEALEANVQNADYIEDSCELASQGRLQLVFAHGHSADTCAPCFPNRRRFLGGENITLRIMLTRRNRFVWALENAAPLFRVRVEGLEGSGAITVTMTTPPAEETQIPLRNRVIELMPFGAILGAGDLPPPELHPHAKKIAAAVGATLFQPEGEGAPLPNADTVFTRVTQSYNPDTRSFQIEPTIVDTDDVRNALLAFAHTWDTDHPEAARLNVNVEPDVRYFYMREWHVAPTLDDIELPTSDDEDGPPLGDTGVIPLFHAQGRAGDYWIASLRSETPHAIVPFDLHGNPDGVRPHGPRHFVAPLFYLAGDNDAVVTADEMRPLMRRTTDDTCVTYTVGDGINSIGDFRSIQQAINALPSEGGRIAVRPGFYPQLVRIFNRRNVLIEGCGESSVLEVPLNNQNANLIEIQNAEGISISGLRLHATRLNALRAQNVVDLNLSDITAVAGQIQNGVFVQGATVSSVFLIDLIDTAATNLRSIVLDAFQRGGLRVLSSELVSMSEIHAFGREDVGPAPSVPLIDLSASALVKLRDSSLDCFGQVGVGVRAAGTQDVQLSNLTIFSRSHKLQTGFREARTGVDIESGQQIVLESSRITFETSPSDHAAVVVKGNQIIVRTNRIEALQNEGRAAAWGGIQVRGGTNSIEIRGNRIVGGVGHGITLGSLLWRRASSPVRTATTRREGAGRGQVTQDSGIPLLDKDVSDGFTDPNGVNLLPEDEGPVRDLVIADNRIQSMATNGISVITLLGLRGLSNELIDVQRARIEGNIITRNLKRLTQTLPLGNALPFPASAAPTSVAVEVSVLPFGGIVLGTASDGIDIRNNVITENGNDSASNEDEDPICGIFILNGDAISITGNRIMNNGRPATGGNLLPGVRAGIAVLLAGTGAASDLFQISSILFNSTRPESGGSSLKISGNTVVQTEGRALQAVGTGPISITNNHFATFGFQGSETVTDRNAIGDAVYVQNMGAPWETHDVAALSPELQLRAASPGYERTLEGYMTPKIASPYLQNVPSNVHAFSGIGGGILFQNNQVVLNWTVVQPPAAGTPIAHAPIALLSNDHVAVSGNQFGMRLVLDEILDEIEEAGGDPALFVIDPIWTLVLAIGATVDVSRNRWASGMRDTSLSLVTYAEIMSSVTFNQMTRDFMNFIRSSSGERLAATVQNRNLQHFGNQSMVSLGRQITNNLDEPLIRPDVPAATTPDNPAAETLITSTNQLINRNVINNLFVRLLRLRPGNITSPVR